MESLSRRAAATHRRLLEAAAEELIETGDVEVAAVARRAGMSVGLPYRYLIKSVLVFQVRSHNKASAGSRPRARSACTAIANILSSSRGGARTQRLTLSIPPGLRRASARSNASTV